MIRVIDVVARHLYGDRGVRVYFGPLVHRLSGYDANEDGWRLGCGLFWGKAGEELETRDDVTCIRCLGWPRW